MNHTLATRSSLAFVAILICCCSIGCDSLINPPEPVVQRLDVRDVFLQANLTCPIRLDAFVTLEEVNMVDDNKVEFLYLVNRTGTPIFRVMDPEVMKAGILKRVQGGPMAKAVIQYDLTMIHTYFDEDGDTISEYTVDRYDLTELTRPGEEALPAPETPETPEPADDLDPLSDEFFVTQEPESDSEEAALDADVDESIGEDSMDVEIVEPPSEPAPPELPQKVPAADSSPDNPAAIRSNPFFQG
ncbi:hypothetical protein [Stieleria varia]|uniref:Uncharacterized protein n=1 Tax=Stieleria varia TaxID=2528005 RepID=A0A5C6A0K0_9BACT|nr:hypothetical protein [Stieleria varia]TWT92063.1 hypothetical protein Pla52n_63600 [Stieleria varia]